MKNLFLVLLLMLSSTLNCQTFYYKCTASVNPQTGVRTSPTIVCKYVTFTKTGCYESDENGNSFGDLNQLFSTSFFYQYRGKKNGMLIFQACKMYNNYRTWIDGMYFYFSEDYNILNQYGGMMTNGNVLVFERKTPPSQGDGIYIPEQLY